MSAWTSIELFFCQPFKQGKELLDEMLKFLAPTNCTLMRAAVQPMGHSEDDDWDEVFQDTRLELVISYLISGKRLHVGLPTPQLAYIVSIVKGMPEDVRGDVQIDSASVEVGDHDIEDCMGAEVELIARVPASISFGGYGSPNDTQAFRDALGKDDYFERMLEYAKERLGEVQWAVIVTA